MALILASCNRTATSSHSRRGRARRVFPVKTHPIGDNSDTPACCRPPAITFVSPIGGMIENEWTDLAAAMRLVAEVCASEDDFEPPSPPNRHLGSIQREWRYDTKPVKFLAPPLPFQDLRNKLRPLEKFLKPSIEQPGQKQAS